VLTVVIPFAEEGKTRLHASPEVRRALSEAMLADIVAACGAVGNVQVVTTGGGQGAAIAAALADVEQGPLLVVNADVPCVTADDLRGLFAETPAGGVALVEADDGTTNALSLPVPGAFAPLYGAGSADRFRAHAARLGLPCVTLRLVNLADDVDTLGDLQRVLSRCGAQTQAAFERIPAEAAV
jgi:2-phospho-L-lactate guanylyltransferase